MIAYFIFFFGSFPDTSSRLQLSVCYASPSSVLFGLGSHTIAVVPPQSAAPVGLWTKFCTGKVPCPYRCKPHAFQQDVLKYKQQRLFVPVEDFATCTFSVRSRKVPRPYCYLGVSFLGVIVECPFQCVQFRNSYLSTFLSYFPLRWRISRRWTRQWTRHGLHTRNLNQS